ncbi:D-alanyl-D-alanine carboxypeptidase [Actinomadura rubrobrunea]|uniref:D-alanyl-D-alanine carboxypeptidase n=1 Tax=Actinomadura rubrobrunea TaxID=115335 RepID=A0A9W6UUS4_9ACTN|nr:D-alanyl-D-alanine carboxypeptidase [Actinomadura rubrobrunea]GLW61970.1 D-alanyl-D-alanine carboxypeptidase [Actinomadura rubrobrunea]
MKDASGVLDDDAEHEAAGASPQDDPDSGAEARPDTGSDTAPDTARDQEESSETPQSPQTADGAEEAPEATTEEEPSASEDDESSAGGDGERAQDDAQADTGHDDDQDEDETPAEPSSESAGSPDAAEAAERVGETTSDDVPDDAPEDRSHDASSDEQADEPEAPEPEDESRPAGTDGHEAGRDEGRTPTAEFRLPERESTPASGQVTVPDLPRPVFPERWAGDTEFGTGATRGRVSEEKPRPAPQAAAPPRPASERPSARVSFSAHPTVEDKLPERPFAPGDTSPEPTAPTYAAAPPQTAPAPPSAAPPAPAQPPIDGAPAEAPQRKRRRGPVIAIAALVLLAGLVTGQLVRPVPEPTLHLTLPTTRYTFQGAAPVLPWPQHGQAAVYVEGLGTMGSSGGQAPTPTASVAKVMTAYVFLRDHPLRPGEQGPTFRISAEEAAQLPARKRRGESLVEVVAGQPFTERKALEALMIVSANNIAHELARWDSGDERAFVRKMNETARSLGMTSTTYTDPSGYDRGTVSTAADQVKLLTAAMKIPAFAEIVSNRTYVPNDGRPPRPGGNILVGRYGVIGGKTGYTDAAGGNFVFAARKQVGNVPTMIVGAVMGQRSSSAMGALVVAQRLVVAAQNALTSATLAPAGAEVAAVDDGLGGRTPLRAAAPVTVVGWGGLSVPVRVTGDPPRRAADGTRVGAVTAGAASTPLAVHGELKEPSLFKRLLRLA